jgi:hypothetical protein
VWKARRHGFVREAILSLRAWCGVQVLRGDGADLLDRVKRGERGFRGHDAMDAWEDDAFDHADTNGDGVLDREEFRRMLQERPRPGGRGGGY